MNAKMKVLALALLGLAGYAGSAVAGCPSSPVPPWTSVTTLSGSTFTIVAGGLDASACRADAAIGASLGAIASVTDDSPTAEPSYRFQFLINPDAFGNFGGTDFITIFRANTTTAVGGNQNGLTVSLVPGPGGAKRVRFNAACTAGRCAQSDTTDLAGVTRIEVQLTQSTLNYWLNAPQGTTEPPATGTVALGDTTAYGGVDRGIMGLSGPSSAFKNAHAGQAVGFDTFDSRRQTYIGW
ncbi:MAG TPA: hypothetical protein VKB52_06830 [Rhodanobacteraceae bacterium]|nr:hypothetical protein [Rhodanobacteraceae bacterium]